MAFAVISAHIFCNNMNFRIYMFHAYTFRCMNSILLDIVVSSLIETLIEVTGMNYPFPCVFLLCLSFGYQPSLKVKVPKPYPGTMLSVTWKHHRIPNQRSFLDWKVLHPQTVLHFSRLLRNLPHLEV